MAFTKSGCGRRIRPATKRSIVEGCLLLDGRLKVGQAAIGGIDFNIPQLGYPLLIGRVYDSRDREGGGFGNGWSMPHEASNVQAEFTYDPAQNWGEDVRGGWMKTYSLISRDRKVVVLRLGDGGVFTFRLDVSPTSSFLYPILNNASFPMTVSYIPVDDTTGTLEALHVDPEVYLYSGGVLASWDGEAYNPTRFRLTLEDGTVSIFDKYLGLLSITDPYGHAISYSDDEITHSSGASLSIERDTSNRIEYIQDQLGSTVEYQYDEDGMLTKVIQHGEGPYPMRVLEEMGYQKGLFERPVLKDIIAPDGTRLGSFEYDSLGRKTALIDHNGTRVLFGYNAPSHEYTMTDRRGNPTSYTYDSEGNVTSITDAEGYTETYTYDADGNVLSKTNAFGYTTSLTYDTDGNVLLATNPLGQTTMYTYDDKGNKLSETNPLGKATVYTYDGKGNMLTKKDALGNVIFFEYDADGLQIIEKDPLGYISTMSYDGQGNLTSKTNPVGYTVEASYDGRGQVLTLKDLEGILLTNAYDPFGNLIQLTEATGATSKFTYNWDGKPTSYADQIGKVMQFTYDPEGKVQNMTDPEGNVISFTYDEEGNVLNRTTTRTTLSGIETLTIINVYDKLGRIIENVDAEGNVSKVEYNAIGKQSAYIDKLGNRIEYDYDANGNLVRIRYPNGTAERFTFDEVGRNISSVNREGKVTFYEYDVLGRLIKTSHPDGSFTKTEYDVRGQVVKQIDEQGNAINYTYDEAGRNTVVTNVLGQSTQYEYSTSGKLTAMIDANTHTIRYKYDANGRRTKIIFHDDTYVETKYDDAGRVIKERDQAGRITEYKYDWRGKLTTVIDALNNETTFEYDEVGNMIAMTDAEGHITRFEYDNLGRMTKRILPLGQEESMVYDGEDNLIERTDFNGQTTYFEYDPDGRLTTKTLPDGTTEVYTYALDGSQKTVTNSHGTTTYNYEVMGRLESQINPDGSTISYGYDNAGNRTSVTTPSGTVTYTFDDLNRLETATDLTTGTTRYTYDNVGNLQTITYPNGTTAEYTYDTLNRLTKLENKKSNGDIISSYNYTLDAAGKRTMVVESHTNRTVEYVYDDTYKLLEEKITNTDGSPSIISYTYDAVGNRLTKTEDGFTTTYVYDNNNRLIQENNIIYRYDDNGNPKEKISAEENILYVYDSENRLIRVETTRFGATIVVEYEYDAEGNRVRKLIDGTIVTTYLVDINRDYAQVLEERDGSGNLLVRYVYGHDLISQTRGGATTYYHYDGLGSTRALTSSAEVVTDTYTYDAFGNLLDKTGVTTNTYLFTGEFFDANVGFYYLRARYLNPAIGRFITMDAFAGYIHDPYSLHKYLYANANPITYSDPSGNFAFVEQVSNVIRDMWTRAAPVRQFIVRYRVMRGMIVGAVDRMIEKWLVGEEVTFGDVLLGAAVGGLFSAAPGGVAYISNKVPTYLLPYLCKLKYLVPVVGGAGLALEIKGIGGSQAERICPGSL